MHVIEYDHTRYATRFPDGSLPILRQARMLIVEDTINREKTKDLSAALRRCSTVSEFTVASMEVWMRVLHETTITDECRSLPIHDVWEAIAVGRKYSLPWELMKGWFEKWWLALDHEGLEGNDLQRLILPCLQFRHAHAFAHVTKRVASESIGHVEDRNPSHHQEIFTTPRIVRKSSLNYHFTEEPIA
jgi:hypothetical protein